MKLKDPNIFYRKVGESLRSVRYTAHLSVKEAAKGMGISSGRISEWENGNRQISLKSLYEICDYYGVSIDYVLGLSTDDVAAKNSVELVRLVRSQLEKVMFETTVLIASSVGPKINLESSSLELSVKANELLVCMDNFVNRNKEFLDMPGGAKVERLMNELAAILSRHQQVMNNNRILLNEEKLSDVRRLINRKSPEFFQSISRAKNIDDAINDITASTMNRDLFEE